MERTMDYINKLLQRAAATRTPSPTPSTENDSQCQGNGRTPTAGHEVKVRFAREFADVVSTSCSAPESLSSASSFHSLCSTLSTKSSSGICPDSVPQLSPNDTPNISYVDAEIPGLDDLILACADIQLNNEDDKSEGAHSSHDLSQDQTFASATDEPPDQFLEESCSDEDSHNTLPRCEESTETLHDADQNQEQNNDPSSTETSEHDRNPAILQERPILNTNFVRDSLSNDALSNTESQNISLNKSVDSTVSQSSVKESASFVVAERETVFETCILSVDSAIDSHISVPTDSEQANLNSTVCLSFDVQETSPRKDLEELLPVEAVKESANLNSTVCLSFDVQDTSPKKDFDVVVPLEAVKESANLNSTVCLSFDTQEASSKEDLEVVVPVEAVKESSNLNSPVCLSFDVQETSSNKDLDEAVPVETSKGSANEKSSFFNIHSSIETSFPPSALSLIENVECPTLPSISTFTSSQLEGSLEAKLAELNEQKEIENLIGSLLRSPSIVSNSTVDRSEHSAPLSSHNLTTDFITAEEKLPTTVDVAAVSISPSCRRTPIPSDNDNSKLLDDIASSIVESPKAPEFQVPLQSSPCEPYRTSPGNTSHSHEKEKHTPRKSDNLLLPGTARKTDNFETEDNTKGHGTRDVITEALRDLDRTAIIETVDTVFEGEIGEPENHSADKLDTTLTLQDAPEIEQYTDFKPQRQSTTLTLPSQRVDVNDLRTVTEEVVDDTFKSTIEKSDPFVSATSEIFQDPTSFDFLLARSNSQTVNRLRAESLYVKFDPLVSNTSMLPQGNVQTINEEQNGKNETPISKHNTPIRNPAIAAIDRLLFYSPLPSGTVDQKVEECQEKIQPKDDSIQEAPLIPDINMSKELELVRTTVLHLEEELEKQKKEHEAELERQKSSLQEKVNKLQAQLVQEAKSKSQMAVVVEEYEKSISRMLTEREKDRANFEQEKANLLEELQAANVHLTNTEAAFNDVHQKYERLKGVVSAYKNNEAVLKESIQENMETIKGLETRYDTLKNHAMTQLEKANFELDAMRKQHEDEIVKLQAMVKKAELKSNSLAELVEQKTKENKELTQILDDVIARVGHSNTD